MSQYMEVIIYVYLRKIQFRELLNKYSRWSRSRANVTAPAKYPGSGSETLVPGYANVVSLKKKLTMVSSGISSMKHFRSVSPM